ncbi:MAG: TonB-dependent receptor [Halieaceae bacterium]
MSISTSEFLNPSPRKALAVAVSTALTGGGHAYAQGELALEEVIVTATKRETSMQELPQSIQAFTTEDIQRRGFRGIEDYFKQIPSLTASTREPGGTSVVFRGVASSGIQFGTNPSSSVYLDEQPITAAGLNPNPRLIDIARVEALSGPQGTLFGDSSQSGTLRIITNKADTEAFSAWVEGGASTVDDGDDGYDLSGMVNLPVSDSVAVRLVGFTTRDAGAINNGLTTSQGGTFTNSAQVESDVDQNDTEGGRLNLRWDINEDWTVDVMGIFQNEDKDGFGDTNTDRSDDLEQGRFYDESLSDDWYQVGLTLEGKLGWADGTLAISYFDRDFKYQADATDYLFEFNKISSYYPYYAAYDFGGDPRGYATNEIESDRWSVEARLATPGASDSRWGGILGVFYSRETSNSLFLSEIDDFAGTAGFAYLAYLQYYYTGYFPQGPTDNWFFGSYDSEIETYAVFGEVTYDITDNLSITAGGRWYDVQRDDKLLSGGLMQGRKPDRATDLVSLDEESDEGDDGFVPKVNITYTIDDDKLVYATYSEGFRSGGGNTVRRQSVLPRNYDSDTLKNYEIGAKTEWLDGSLRFNITGYYMEWDDIQIQANDPQPLVFSLGTINFPQAEIKGVEMDFAWVPLAGLTIDGSYSYLDAELSEDETVFEETGFPIEATDGTDLPLAPEWKAAIGAEYVFNFDIFGADPSIRLDFSHIDDSVNALEGLESIVFAPEPRTQSSYDTWDLRAGLDGDGWSANFYIRNLDDERGEVFYNNRWGKERLSITTPRTYGFAIRKSFN